MLGIDLQSRIEQLASRLVALEQQVANVSDDPASHFQDSVSELKAAVEAMKELQGDRVMADHFVGLAGVILIALNRNGCVESINHEGAAILGYGVSELIGRDWIETCIPPDQQSLLRSVFERLMRKHTEAAEYFENEVITKSGERRIISWRNANWKDSSGKIIGTISSGEDVTENRRTEAQLRAVVNTAVDAIITIDERGMIASFNPAAEKMFQYTAGEMVGKNVKTLMPQPYRDEHDSYLHNYMTTRVPKIIGIGREALARRKDGSVFPIELAVSEVEVEDAHLFTGIVRDITDRMRLEREVLEISTQEQQRIGRDLHDGLGQELTGIAFLTDVHQKRLAAADRPEAKDAGELKALVNQAIDHTRALVRGLCPVNLDEDGFMFSMQQLAESIAQLHGVKCRFTFDEPVFISDYNISTNLYFIAHEAANNAVRHGNPKRIDIELHTNGRHALIQVKDDGQGMPKSGNPGTGRGLEIMNYRARVIGGTISVKPNQPTGTIVSCTFLPDDPSKMKG